MEKAREEKEEEYILNSRINIDRFLNKKDYKRAFVLLILVLDGKQKNEFIDYYSKHMKHFGFGL
jgi:hypothetical protein